MAQKEAVHQYVNSVGGHIVREFTEIESGRKRHRPQLQDAVRLCRRLKARLVIAKFDRLARNAAFLLALRDSGVDFVAADFPSANKLTIGIMAVFAEHEADMIGERTKAALIEAKRRGVRLGNPRPAAAAVLGADVLRKAADRFASNLIPVVRQIQAAGVVTLAGIASFESVQKSP